MPDLFRRLNRRDFLARSAQIAAGAAAARLLASAAAAQSFADDPRVARTPLVDRGFAEVRQIGRGVYALISNRAGGLTTRCNGGFVVGRDAALLFEGYQTPAGAAFQLEALRMVSAVPVRAAVDSHWHHDHALGNTTYGAQGIPIWAHAKAAARMVERYAAWQQQELAGYLAPFERRLRAARTEAEREHARSDIEAVSSMFQPVKEHAVTLPNHPLQPAELPMTVELGGVSVIIEAHPGHTDTDLILRVPEQNIAFGGDLVVNAQYPTNIDGDPVAWRETMARFAEFDRDTIWVPGHGPLCGVEAAALMRDIFDDIEGQAERLFRAGVPFDEAAERYVVPEPWRGMRMFSWGFTVGRTIQQHYARWGSRGEVLTY